MIGQVMLTLFAIIVVGYIAGKLGYMGGTFDKRLSKVVIDITCPALILSSAMTGELPDRQYILPLLGISVITYLLLTGVAFLLPRFLTKKKEGYLKGVFHRDDLGDIDLAWGSAPTDYTGKGLAHIIRKHIKVLKDFKDLDEAWKFAQQKNEELFDFETEGLTDF